jgi:outer membrane lipoprotein-sorting protein
LRIVTIAKPKAFFERALIALLLVTAPACLVRKVTKVTHIHNPSPNAPEKDASLAELVAKIDAWSLPIHTMTATVDLAPTTGSVYSGVIKEYHDVEAFILMHRPSNIRMQGKAPVVRTTIFDMVSNGDEFRLYIPLKQKFIVGKTTVSHPANNALENLRPQHILQALMVPPINADTESTYRKKLTPHSDPTKRYFVVGIVEAKDKHVLLQREISFDRSNLELVRVQFYDSDGTCTEDVHYSDYQDFKGIHYPTHIDLERPEDDYEVKITIEKATFNTTIPEDRFELNKPSGAELIDLDAPKPQTKPAGK